ncbi:IclR family transcriptional regulator [Microlunatus soli]|uniref:Glycerol operon regulatory protein n=1 Tax=Microlunatus soli TaxID=630515 RepID=A0A1H1TYN5_9ACTN|nr:IclR family transcriptional regulator [Microlunatus soli]SDS65066.1 transcriptional regulator, IclR family [Microlunatus soli]
MTKRGGGVQSVERAFALLELMVERGDQSLTELAQAMDLPVPTIHRFLQTLVGLGYARQRDNRRYGLGLGLARLASPVGTEFSPIAQPHLASLVAEIGESANLAVLDGNMVVYVAHVPSPHAMRLFTENGHRAHTHATGVGKAILAQLPEAHIDRILDRAGMPAATSRTITDRAKLHRELAKINRQGYATDAGEQEDGVFCYAVPVLGLPISMAVSVSGPTFRMTKELGAKAIPLLQAEAEALRRDFAGPLSDVT